MPVDPLRTSRKTDMFAVLRNGTAGERRRGAMPMFMDHHKGVEGLTAEAVADAHKKDLEIQGEYGVKYHRYWFNEETGEVFCLAEELRTRKRRRPSTAR